MAARFASVCGLCGSPIEPGERIFKLPDKRTGAGTGPWVCWTCRWPSASEPTVETIVRKLRHRLALHQSIGLSKAEAAILAEALSLATTTQRSDELVALCDWLTTSVHNGVPANLTMDDARTALITLDSDGSR